MALCPTSQCCSYWKGSLQVALDLGVMAIKGYAIFSKVSLAGSLVSYPGHSKRRMPYPSVVVQLAYSTAPPARLVYHLVNLQSWHKHLFNLSKLRNKANHVSCTEHLMALQLHQTLYGNFNWVNLNTYHDRV